MTRADRLSTAALVRIDVVDPASAEAAACLRSYFAELDERFETGFDAAASLFPDVADMRPPAGLFVLARLHGEAIGCGGLKWQRGEWAYLKRMWVARAARGLSVGRRLLTELESLAADHGDTAVRLETNRALAEAISLYRSAGYVEVPPFNDEPYAHHWFEKPLQTPRSDRGR